MTDVLDAACEGGSGNSDDRGDGYNQESVYLGENSMMNERFLGRSKSK